MAVYSLDAVARLPQGSSPPILQTVDPIDFESLTWTDEVSAAQTLDASVLISALTDPVVQRLRELHNLPTELWLWRDGVKVFAGPLIGWSVQGDKISLKAAGLLTYLRWMIAMNGFNNAVYTATDQFTIVADLIDNWQETEYGHFGIDTSTVGTSGEAVDVTYVFSEWTFVLSAIEELAKSAVGFDFEIDPASRALRCWYPVKGINRSVGDDAIVFDQSNIDNWDVQCAAGPGEIASLAFASSTDTEQGTLTSLLFQPNVRPQFGAAVIATNFDKITDLARLTTANSAALNATAAALMIPGPTVRVTADNDPSKWTAGDTVSYDLNDRLGLSGPFRVRKRSVAVDQTGRELMSLEFV